MNKEDMMNTQKHTPGPWTYLPPDDEFENGHLFSEDKGHGGFLCAFVAGIENPADASLIASAPDLLEALQAVVPELEYMAVGMTHAAWKTAEVRKRLDSVRAVIAKATGGEA